MCMSSDPSFQLAQGRCPAAACRKTRGRHFVAVAGHPCGLRFIPSTGHCQVPSRAVSTEAGHRAGFTRDRIGSNQAGEKVTMPEIPGCLGPDPIAVPDPSLPRERSNPSGMPLPKARRCPKSVAHASRHQVLVCVRDESISNAVSRPRPGCEKQETSPGNAERTDLESIMVIGAGPIVIGQACEFDYSGTQACKACARRVTG